MSLLVLRVCAWIGAAQISGAAATLASQWSRLPGLTDHWMQIAGANESSSTLLQRFYRVTTKRPSLLASIVMCVCVCAGAFYLCLYAQQKDDVSTLNPVISCMR